MFIADVSTSGLYVAWIFGVLGILITLGGIGVTVMGVLEAKEPRNERDYPHRKHDYGPLLFGLGILATGLVWLVVTLAATWPLKYEYHHWVTKRGVVAAQSSRLIKDGDSSVSQRIVIRDQQGHYYGVDDTRAALLKVGDEFAIKCKKSHQWFQQYEQDGWECRWGA